MGLPVAGTDGAAGGSGTGAEVAETEGAAKAGDVRSAATAMRTTPPRAAHRTKRAGIASFPLQQS